MKLYRLARGMKMKKTTRMIYIGLLVAQALVLYIVEGMILVPFITPGAKLGLANLVTVIALYTFDNNIFFFLVVTLRLILSAMLGGNLSSFMYNAAGVILSYYVMIFAKKEGKENGSIIGVKMRTGLFFIM